MSRSRARFHAPVFAQLTMTPDQLPTSWRPLLAAELAEPYFAELAAFVAEERAAGEVFPPEDEVFSALELTPYDDVKVLVLGQDPYHGDGQAHGLSFSVKPGVAIPPSLRNMYKELHDDLGCATPSHGHLAHWAKQGVLMLNAVLTVRAHEANSHKNRGWERFTDAILRSVNAHPERVVFVLWGGYAKKKAKLVTGAQHLVLTSAHPSPLSAHRGFFGSRPFSRVNAALAEAGRAEIDWQVPS